jgi:2-polyprenyl-3-methyl-5-hydroxy-6-metoxy-1,4-benzoquinol methylase
MSKKEVAEFFDSYSDQFNAIYGNKNSLINSTVNRFFRKSMRLRFEHTVRGCQPVEGKSVVDIGCGPGHYSVRLAKMGAQSTLGLDFASSMIDIANENAARAVVESRCQFVCSDFLSHPFNRKFDYAVVMGFMDYVEQPEKVIDKVLAVTKGKAFFSFPADGGILAWQRRQRYKNRCKLFLYKAEELERIFGERECRGVEIQKISRDFFVTVSVA